MALDLAVLDEAFASVSFEDWQTAALKAAKADAIQALHSTVEGLDIAPLAARSSKKSPIAFNRPHWLAFQRIDDPNVARGAAQAKTDAEGGADGLALAAGHQGSAFRGA